MVITDFTTLLRMVCFSMNGYNRHLLGEIASSGSTRSPRTVLNHDAVRATKVSSVGRIYTVSFGDDVLVFNYAVLMLWFDNVDTYE